MTTRPESEDVLEVFRRARRRTGRRAIEDQLVLSHLEIARTAVPGLTPGQGAIRRICGKWPASGSRKPSSALIRTAEEVSTAMPHRRCTGN